VLRALASDELGSYIALLSSVVAPLALFLLPCLRHLCSVETTRYFLPHLEEAKPAGSNDRLANTLWMTHELSVAWRRLRWPLIRLDAGRSSSFRPLVGTAEVTSIPGMPPVRNGDRTPAIRRELPCSHRLSDRSRHSSSSKTLIPELPQQFDEIIEIGLAKTLVRGMRQSRTSPRRWSSSTGKYPLEPAETQSP